MRTTERTTPAPKSATVTITRQLESAARQLAATRPARPRLAHRVFEAGTGVAICGYRFRKQGPGYPAASKPASVTVCSACDAVWPLYVAMGAQ